MAFRPRFCMGPPPPSLSFETLSPPQKQIPKKKEKVKEPEKEERKEESIIKRPCVRRSWKEYIGYDRIRSFICECTPDSNGMCKKNSLFIEGPPGSGKSFLVSLWVDILYPSVYFTDCGMDDFVEKNSVTEWLYGKISSRIFGGTQKTHVILVDGLDSFTEHLFGREWKKVIQGVASLRNVLLIFTCADMSSSWARETKKLCQVRMRLFPPTLQNAREFLSRQSYIAPPLWKERCLEMGHQDYRQLQLTYDMLMVMKKSNGSTYHGKKDLCMSSIFDATKFLLNFSNSKEERNQIMNAWMGEWDFMMSFLWENGHTSRKKKIPEEENDLDPYVLRTESFSFGYYVKEKLWYHESREANISQMICELVYVTPLFYSDPCQYVQFPKCIKEDGKCRHHKPPPYSRKRMHALDVMSDLSL